MHQFLWHIRPSCSVLKINKALKYKLLCKGKQNMAFACFLHMWLQNDNFYSFYSYSKLLKIAVKVPLPLSVAMLAFGQMHLYRVPHFVTFSLLLHVLCCFV